MCSGHCKAPLALQARRAYLRGMFKAFEFCIPTSGTNVPNGTDWLHEIKYDGYRLRVERDGDRVRLITKSRAIRFTDRIFSREMVERMETSQQKTRKAQEIHNTNVWDAITVALEELIKNLEELDLRMTLAAAVRFKETFEASAELPSENHIGELTFRSTGRKIWYRHIYSSNRRSPSPHGGHASAAIMDSFFMARSP